MSKVHKHVHQYKSFLQKQWYKLSTSAMIVLQLIKYIVVKAVILHGVLGDRKMTYIYNIRGYWQVLSYKKVLTKIQ